VTHISLTGELGIATQEVPTQLLARTVAVDDADLVVDLSRVVFVDVATIGVLERDFLRLRSRNLVVRAPSEAAPRSLETGGLADLIDWALAASLFQVGLAGNSSSVIAADTAEMRVIRRW